MLLSISLVVIDIVWMGRQIFNEQNDISIDPAYNTRRRRLPYVRNKTNGALMLQVQSLPELCADKNC